MRPIWPLALNTLLGRPRRTLLVTLAMALATALLVAVSCSIATVQGTIEYSVRRALGSADVRIVHPAGVPFDRSLVPDVLSWTSVRAVAERLSASLTLRGGPSGEPFTVQARGMDFGAERVMDGIHVISGTIPVSAGEILIDDATRERLGDADTSAITAIGAGGRSPVSVAGLYERTRFLGFQQPRIMIGLGDLEQLADMNGRRSMILIALDGQIDPAAFCQENAQLVPPPLKLEPAEMARSGFDRRVRASRIGLTIATVMAFLAASFIIVIGMTTGVTERQREIAIMRAVGADRLHLFLSQILAGIAQGAGGLAAGIPVGLGITAVLYGVWRENLPGGLVVNAFALRLTMVAALVSGAGGAIIPALLAIRVSPLDAMRPQARARPSRTTAICAVAAVMLMAVHLPLPLLRDPEWTFWGWVIAGLPLLFIGAFLLSVPVYQVIARALGAVLARVLRLPRDLLLGTLRTGGVRQGFTAGALMVGMALMTTTWAESTAARRDWLDQLQFADGIVFRPGGLSEETCRAIEALPDVSGASPLRRFPVRIVNRQIFGVDGLSPPNTMCIAVAPEEFLQFDAITWVRGEPGVALAQIKGGRAVLVSDRFLVARGVEPGETLELALGETVHSFEIAGVVAASGLEFATQFFEGASTNLDFAISCVFMDAAAARDLYGVSDVTLLQVRLREGSDEEALQRQIVALAPGAQYRSGLAMLATLRQIADVTLGIQTSIAFGALCLAALAVANVVAANVAARTFEWGVLRGIGLSRSALPRLLIAEAVVLAGSAAIVGAVLGGFLARMNTTLLAILGGVTVHPSPPWTAMSSGAMTTLMLTLLAVIPASRRVMRASPALLLSAGRSGQD